MKATTIEGEQLKRTRLFGGDFELFPPNPIGKSASNSDHVPVVAKSREEASDHFGWRAIRLESAS